MSRLDQIVPKIRTKNAGPFWLTVDIFCGEAKIFDHLKKNLQTAQVAAAFHQPTAVLKRFDIADLNVIKLSLPRIVVQGSRADRDMHASQWAWLVGGIEVPAP